MRRITGFLAILCAVARLLAPAAAGDLEPSESAIVAAVIDGDTVVLEGGEQVRLVGIQAPKLPLGRPDFEPWPLADEAKAALEALGLGRRVTLFYGGRRVDRHGRRLAHLYDEDGVWLQGALLRRGLARVYSFRDNRSHVAEMLALERAARDARLGIWDHRFYAVRRAEPPAVPRDRFELVGGRVVAVAARRTRTYLDFGPDWHTDFTVSVGAKERRLFKREGFDLAGLEGRTIRVRGWVKWWNGPMIEITHPEQIEVLSP